MDDLVQWLRGQLDEDERIARAAAWCDEAASWHAEPSPFGARDKGQRWYIEDAMDDGVVTHVDPAASDDEGVARHLARHDPARVLREVDAKRQIIAEHDVYGRGLGGRMDCQSLDFPCRTLRLLALPYADRPGYRAEWKP